MCHFGVRVISFVSRFSEMTKVNYLIYKSDTDEFICKAEIDTDVENKPMDTKVGRGGCNELGDWD